MDESVSPSPGCEELETVVKVPLLLLLLPGVLRGGGPFEVLWGERELLLLLLLERLLLLLLLALAGLLPLLPLGW